MPPKNEVVCFQESIRFLVVIWCFFFYFRLVTCVLVKRQYSPFRLAKKCQKGSFRKQTKKCVLGSYLSCMLRYVSYIWIYWCNWIAKYVLFKTKYLLSQYPESVMFRDCSDLNFKEYLDVIKEPIAMDVIKEKLDRDNPEMVSF